MSQHGYITVTWPLRDRCRLELTMLSQTMEEDPAEVVAGEDLTVTVRALDAYDNLCESQVRIT